MLKEHVIRLAPFSPVQILPESEYLKVRESFWRRLERKIYIHLLENQISFKKGQRVADTLGISIHEEAWPILRQHPAVHSVRSVERIIGDILNQP